MPCPLAYGGAKISGDPI